MCHYCIKNIYKGVVMLNFLKIVLLSIIITLGVSANEDLLSRATNGAATKNIVGVKMLDDTDMKQVIGGYDFYRLPELDFRSGILYSLAFVVTDDNGKLPAELYKVNGGTLDTNTVLIAHLRLGNGKPQYYLQVYNADKTYFDYAGPQYSKIMTDFQRIIR